MDCIDYLTNKFKGVDQQTIVSLMEQAKKERARLRAKFGDIADMQDRLLARIQDKVANAETVAYAHKRALQLQYVKRMNNFNFIMENFAGKEEEGLSALLVGTNRAGSGTRFSVDARQQALRQWYAGALLADIKDLGDVHLELLKKGAMDREIANALWSIDNDNPAAAYKGPKEAMEIAQVVHKWQEKARADLNASGAWVGKEQGYIVRQSHDRARIYKAGFEKWRDTISPLLDWERIAQEHEDPQYWLPGMERDVDLRQPEAQDKFLHTVWEHLAVTRKGNTEKANPLTGKFTSSIIGDTAADASAKRVLHFKDADSWFTYNQEFGSRSLREAILGGLSHSADVTSLMRTLGPSPSAGFKQLYDMIHDMKTKAGDYEGVKRLDAAARKLNNRLKEVDGSLADFRDPSIAAIGRNIRAWQSVTKLGGAMISSFTDAGVASSELAYQGKSFFGSLANNIVGLVHGRGTKDQQRILSSMGVFFDSMVSDTIGRFSADESMGAMTKMMNTFFNLNGLNWWTHSWRRAVGLTMAHDLALEKGLAWSNLTNARRRVLSMYGIREDEWNVMKFGETKAADGREYFTPDSLDSIPDDAISAYLKLKGKKPAAFVISQTREELAEKLRTYYRDRINFAVLEPDAKTRAAMHQGLGTGTPLGEVIRCAFQFKSFPTAFAQKILGRELYGRAGDPAALAISSLARLIIMSTLFGYGSMVCKDLLKGKTPRDPSNPKTWLAAFTQGGGAGIYGDFILGQYNRFGQDFTTTAMGPTAGTINDLASIVSRVREGDSAAQASLRFIMNNIPGNNLYFVRGPMDYLITYNLFEMMNPGYFKRIQKRTERENSQTFFASPVKW